MRPLTRRLFLSLAAAGTSGTLGFGQEPERTDASPADITLRISEITLELAPGHLVKTTGYNGQSPGPLLRAPEGKPLVVDVFNETKKSELVHWHGLHIPSEVDGAHEEGTPPVPARSYRRYVFTPAPAGARWYHSHGFAGRNLGQTTYSGQFGMFVVEPRSDPGRYDLEVPILLHEWGAYWDDVDGPPDVGYRLFSVNGKALGAGEPVRVRNGQRVLFRFLNASATLAHQLALPGHTFRVLALDGNPVPSPQTVSMIELAPAERVEAIVEMNNPGVWLLGEVRDKQRLAGMGIVIEYSDAKGPPRWQPSRPLPWDYTIFGEDRTSAAVEPDHRVPLVFRQTEGSHRWTINGKSFPRTEPIAVQPNRRYRWILDNQTADPHPMHLHRHSFELVRVAGKPTAGVWKDVVMAPAWKEVEVDVFTDHPGPTLFHCHQQYHMDSGFMTLMKYQ
jgi:FtsP/CotA-like multicopper oxidase with cupredoxin domain